MSRHLLGTTGLALIGPGMFQMMEIHNLYFDFKLSWWNVTNETPLFDLPNLMEYLNTNFFRYEYTMHLNLVNRGSQVGERQVDQGYKEALVLCSHSLIV